MKSPDRAAEIDTPARQARPDKRQGADRRTLGDSAARQNDRSRADNDVTTKPDRASGELEEAARHGWVGQHLTGEIVAAREYPHAMTETGEVGHLDAFRSE